MLYYWLTPLVASIVAVALAFCGWHLTTRLAKHREAHDLYTSAQSLLEQLDADGRRAWKSRPQSLDDYNEQKLLSKTAALEQRLELLSKYYGYPANPPGITDEQIASLRRLLTATPDQFPAEQDRTVHIHHLTADMVRILLEQNHAYISKSPWWRAKRRRAGQ